MTLTVSICSIYPGAPVSDRCIQGVDLKRVLHRTLEIADRIAMGR